MYTTAKRRCEGKSASRIAGFIFCCNARLKKCTKNVHLRQVDIRYKLGSPAKRKHYSKWASPPCGGFVQFLYTQSASGDEHKSVHYRKRNYEADAASPRGLCITASGTAQDSEMFNTCFKSLIANLKDACVHMPTACQRTIGTCQLGIYNQHPN